MKSTCSVTNEHYQRMAKNPRALQFIVECVHRELINMEMMMMWQNQGCQPPTSSNIENMIGSQEDDR